MNIREINRDAWNRNVEAGNRWTQPVSPETIAKARQGQWEIILTPVRSVPKSWFPPLAGAKVLCLASGGGQQGPVLAAAGADVTVYDMSEKQLGQDRVVAEREQLTIRTVQGDMADLSCFADETFDLIVHPVSNVFAQSILPVWREAARVLKRGGVLMAGFVNPLVYIFSIEAEERGVLEVKHSIPYADHEQLPKERLEAHLRDGVPLEFGHSLEDQLKGQLDAGLVLTDLFEDNYGGESPLDKHINTFIATKAVKLKV
ncbi:class I SAM-dependent methyltransferase [Paenibacillus ginsengarvi]|uniref:Class I SAM-dependent methyltransferase n=1 Tax=Paenibacillus ginsengarvi TaxID=400777 RepID=A0A3B0BXA3_9BACL|nr:class I SAM-dependent methyltransferase [Paenibacillus ginsengarvi]RKN76056.1 class I SAM-dependent methyltransferase [Paenibacillus ginsengarvi]